MANFIVINDNTLRQRLRQHGFRPDGPITDTTRDVYLRKLQQLDNARTAQRTCAITQIGMNPPINLFQQMRPTLSPSPAALQVNNELVARSAPSGDANRPSIIVHGKCGYELGQHLKAGCI